MFATQIPTGPPRCIGIFFLLLVGASCGPRSGQTSSEAVPASAAFQPTLPWTKAFDRPAVLLADEIRLEGPRDLLEHVVVGQDTEAFETDLETRPEGLWQSTTVKPGQGRPVRGHLDRLELVATRRITVLARPGDAPVIVRGIGNAFWSLSDESDSKRGEALELRGERGR